MKCTAEIVSVSLDHILMLQTSLNHYEYILSHCQPAYMSYLGVTSSIVRGDISNMILALSCVTVGYLPMQFVTCECQYRRYMKTRRY
jgi:Mg2+ and Co2+ transporter CorA